MRLMRAIQAHQWAILPEYLDTIAAIAQRAGDDPAAVAKRLGRPLDNSQSVEMREGGVAVLTIAGPIFPRANLLNDISGATSVQMLALDLQAMLDQPDVRAIVLAIDSPGGVVNGVSDLADMIAAARGIKPIIAVTDGMAASAAYWLAAAASEIVISETSMLGSIGVVAAATVQVEPNLAGERIIDIVSSNAENKVPDPLTADGAATIRATLDAIEHVFIARVARFRGVSAEKVATDFGRGGLVVGAQAVAAGMADRIGTIEDVIAELAPPTLTTIQGARPMSKTTPNVAADASMKPDVVDEPTAPAANDQAAAPPDLDTIRAEARDAGAAAERARISGIRAYAEPGNEALIDELVADGETTPDQAAARVLAVQRQRRESRRAAIAADDPVVAAAPSASGEQTDEPIDARALADAAKTLIADAAVKGERISATDAVRRVRDGETAA